VPARIVQLQSEPDATPATPVARSHAEYAAVTDLVDMIKEDLVTVRIAIGPNQQIVSPDG